MNQDEFNKVEAPAIAQLISMGWVYVHGKKLSPDYLVDGEPERAFLKGVVLV